METNSIYSSNNEPFISPYNSNQQAESELDVRVNTIFEDIVANQDNSAKLQGFNPALRDQILDKVHHLFPNRFAREVLREGAQSHPETVELVVSDTLDSKGPGEFFNQIDEIKNLIRGALLKQDDESFARSSIDQQKEALNQDVSADSSVTIALSADQPETNPQVSEQVLQTSQTNISLKPLSEQARRHLPLDLISFFENREGAQDLVDIAEVGNQVSLTLPVYDQKITYIFEEGLWASETRVNLKNDQTAHFDVTSQQLNDYLRAGFTETKVREITGEIERAINPTNRK